MVKKTVLLVLVCLLSLTDFCQQYHFIYLQTENSQPFYLRFKNSLLSSSASGYLIIPRLSNGNYDMTIGFPKNEWPEQTLSCAVNNRDAGYILKNFTGKGWGLFNLQTMDIVMAEKAAGIKPVVKKNSEEGFNNVLSNVVHDPAIGNKTVIDPGSKEPVKKPKIELKKTSAPAQKIIVLMRKVEENQSEMVYVDLNGLSKDTIRVWIPPTSLSAIKPTEVPVMIKPKEEAVVIKPTKEPVGIKQKEEPVIVKPKEELLVVKNKEDGDNKGGDKKFLDLEVPVKKDVKDSISGEIKNVPGIVKTPVEIVNTDCRNQAGDEDFYKLRKKMVAEDNDDDMINVARKIFKTKCFTTEQVKNLAVLFLKDEGRYKFFDTAYPYIYDSVHFSSLESLLTENYYITRFRAMIKH